MNPKTTLFAEQTKRLWECKSKDLQWANNLTTVPLNEATYGKPIWLLPKYNVRIVLLACVW